MLENKITQVENYVKSVMSNEVAHDFKHVDRVRNWALKIAQEEKFINLELVEIAALMHDIGMSRAEKRSQHGEVGAEMAIDFLRKNNFLTPEEIAEVANAIKYHNKNREGEGQLLEIIRDADMIDMLGPIGIMRAFTSQSLKPEYDVANVKGDTWGMTAKDFDRRFDSGIGVGPFILDQINFQISCYDNLSTECAKRQAKSLVDFMREFILRLEKEINV